MKSLITPGTKCLLDGHTEVIVLKAATRSNSSYAVEIPGRSIEMVASDRLTAFTHHARQPEIEDIFDFEE